jgi:excisionase family DNA binding protein
MTGWFKPKAAARYAGVSERTLREWLKDGLRQARLPSGRILIQREWVDDYLNAFEVTADSDIGTIADEVMNDLALNRKHRT